MTLSLEVALVVKPATRHRSEENRLGTYAESMVYEYSQIVLICSERSCISCGVRLLRIVVTELDEKILPCLEVLLYAVPDAKRLETLGSAAGLRIVCYDHIGVKM